MLQVTLVALLARLTECALADRHEMSDSQAQAESLQAEVRILQQHHADALTVLDQQHDKALVEVEEQQQQSLRNQQQQHQAAVRALQVLFCLTVDRATSRQYNIVKPQCSCSKCLYMQEEA